MKAPHTPQPPLTARRLRELYQRLHGQPVTAAEIEQEQERRDRDCGFGEVS